ncbi:alpha/beta hydrolase [Streptomyces sp. SL13]|uniref:Alpha/beta hydrolase n=1 Tax=Streptantibioticus silvisoli TaxID=2705255 RepID=A0AA90KIL6_9ACTN|nr:alpha/beta hydrolase [Streptantibioticus silvisoli]MDI5972719.1 alpha/beta hydrolase [Streptantibioticus silvisoli]
MSAGGTSVGRTAGLVGAAIGVLAAGAAAGVAIERMTVGRGMRRKARQALDAAGPFGTLRGEPGTAVAADGTELAYEVEELADGTAPGLTVVFSHGYCLNQDSWHFQRALLRGAVRAVYWDQRSHGRSEHGRDQAAGEPATIDQLGRDLRAVIDAAAPDGPLVLAGHSMGGMTVMAFAEQFPQLVAERVAGVFLTGTSAGKLAAVTLGLPTMGAKAFRVLAPGVLKAMGAQAGLVERGRRVTADLFAGIVKHYSFASEVDPAVARLAERMIESTPIDVVAEFYPAFTTHDKGESLAVFDGLPALVLTGDKDLLTPSDHSADIADHLPGAELVIVPQAGHLVLLEYPDVVNARFAALLVRAADRAGVPLPPAVRAVASGEPAPRPAPED